MIGRSTIHRLRLIRDPIGAAAAHEMGPLYRADTGTAGPNSVLRKENLPFNRSSRQAVR